MNGGEGQQKPVPTGVLERGLHLLECFSLGAPRLQLRELAQMSGLDKATALRALKTLVAYGFLEKSADGFYWPGPANLRLATIFRSTSNIVSRLEGSIDRIAVVSGQAAAFFVRSGEQRMCLIRDQQRRDFRYFVEVGASVPMDAGGAAAHVLAAYTDFDPANAKQVFVREHGYYTSRGEKNPHLVSTAVPVFESDGSFIGAAAITALRHLVTEDDITRFIEVIQQEIVSARLGSTPALVDVK
ncbi:IclR family transcriptional regulator [Mangrovicella endophytica]|uniref:IclR family transcriptional regulator n=1 Tax=Mangrovicella endophytica TaxID=2066697 RepID=UPI000C9E0622|nr:helix-turn-helix domain-containing protein [Mangrovicella endophytica]